VATTPYGRIARKTHKDRRFKALCREDRDFLKYVWSCEEADGSPGLFRLTIMEIVETCECTDPETVEATVLGTVIATVRERLKRLTEQGWIEYDFEAKMMFCPKWHQFDPPANGNVVIAMLNRALNFPETGLFLSKGGKVLAQEVKRFPTPRVCAGLRSSGSNRTEFYRVMFPTPNTSNSTGAGEHGDGGLNLQTAVKMLPTPQSRDWKDTSQRASHGNTTDCLPNAIGGQLNPTWVEWLMGWPLGWTDLEPLEMDGFRKWLREFLR